MTSRIRFTEYLDLDVEREMWHCHSCDHALIGARESYKRGCLVAQRDPREIHAPVLEGEYSFSPDPDWSRIVEFYCPNCGRQIETEYLPPGHPITHDIELDVDSLKARLKSGDYVIVNGKLTTDVGGGSPRGSAIEALPRQPTASAPTGPVAAHAAPTGARA